MHKQFYDTLLEYKKLNRISFHTPGHKNKFFDKNLFSLDYTELPDTDCLYNSHGPISKTETLAQQIFSSQKTLLSAGGCTLAIQTMLKLVSQKGHKIIISRDAHQSAINTICLLDLLPIYIMPGQSLIKISEIIEKNQDACALYLTSPNYFGKMWDIKSISNICKKFKIPLIVDNAHGTHLKFLTQDLHPLTLGADISADSVHKTLPALTGAALLHINNKKFCEFSKYAMSIFGSTSPSFPILASLDLCLSWLEKNGKESFKRLEENVKNFFDKIKNTGLAQKKELVDPLRICLETNKIKINGNQAANFLRDNGIEPEYSDFNNLILIPSPMNQKQDFEKLVKVILKMTTKISKIRKISDDKTPDLTLPVSVISPNQAILGKKEKVNIKDSVNRICAEAIAPCPPGIPIIMPGEKISHKIKKSLSQYGIKNLIVCKE